MRLVPERPVAKAESDASGGVDACEKAIIAILLVLPVVVFAQVRNFDFVNYDDGSYVTECPQVQQGLTAESIDWAFSRSANSVTANWHPLTWLSLMLDVTLFGVNSRGMHLMNLAIHIANVLLVYYVVNWMTRATYKSAFVAAVFAVHPLHVESVAWVSERKDVLSTLFVLIALASYLKYTMENKRRWVIFSLCCFVLSLMAKQMYVTFPFLLLLLDFWPLRRTFGTTNEGAITLRQSVIEKLPYLATALAFCAIAVVGQQDGDAVGSLADYPADKRLLNAGVVYLLYLKKTLLPVQLAVFYPYPDGGLALAGTLSILAVSAMTAGAFQCRTLCPHVFVGWCWYLGTLVPVIGIVQIGAQRMADRYTYFPLIGLAIVVVWSVAGALERFRIGPRSGIASGCIILGLLAWRAHNQTSHWKNSLMLFSHATSVAESSLAFTKLGFEQAQKRNFDQAASSLYRALEIDADYVAAHRSLGNLCLAEGRPKAAIGHLQRTLRLDSADAEAHYNLGIVFSGLGQIEAAIEHYQQALEITAGKAEVAANLGTAYLLQNNASRAAEYLGDALQKNPDLIQARYYLGLAYHELGRSKEALSLLLKLGDTGKLFPDLDHQLVRIYKDLGDHERAAFHMRKIAPAQK